MKEEIHSRYIDERIELYENGIYALEAHQGSGKTELIKRLKGAKVLMTSARNSLGEQIVNRMPLVIPRTHLVGDGDQTLTKEELQQYDSYFINLASFHKLTTHHDYQFEYFPVDEILLTWGFSFDNAFVSTPALTEFRYRLIHTPIVILLAGHYPDFLLRKLKELAQHRKDKNFQHIKYFYPIGEGREFYWASNGRSGKAEVETFIEEQMLKRQKDRGNKFLWREEVNDRTQTNYRSGAGDYIAGKRFPRGVLHISERSDAIPNLVASFQKVYPWANIVGISGNKSDGDNLEDHPDLLETLSDPNRRAIDKNGNEIDMLIASPVLGVGINIRNEFDLVVGDFAHVNPKGTGEQILQSLLRDRECPLIVIRPRATDKFFYPADEINKPLELEEPSESYQQRINPREGTLEWYCFKYDIPVTQVFTRDEISGAIAPNDFEKLKDKIEYKRWAEFNTTHRMGFVDQELKRLGFTERRSLNRALTKHMTQAGKLNLWTDPDYLRHAEEDYGRPITTDKDRVGWDKGNWRNNERHRKELDNQAWLTSNPSGVTDNKYKLHELVYNALKEKMKIDRNTYLMTLPQWVGSRSWQNLTTNKKRWNVLLASWSISIKNDTTLAPLETLAKILRKYNYFAEAHAEDLKARQFLKGKARKDNLTAYNKWEKPEQYSNKSLQRYLFHGLETGELEFSKLTQDTQNFLRSFDHILIEDYKERTHV